MVISNAKYGKKPEGIKNRAYLPELDEVDSSGTSHESGMDFHDFIIPRYEEMKFLSIDELTV